LPDEHATPANIDVVVVLLDFRIGRVAADAGGDAAGILAARSRNDCVCQG